MATNTALEAQKYQFGQVYAASMAKMHPNHRCIPTKEKYDIMLDALKNKVANLKDKKCYRYIKDYIVVTVGDIDRIFAKKHLPTQQGDGDIDVSTVPRMCHEDELFDIIHDAHLSVGHRKAEKTYDYLKSDFLMYHDLYVTYLLSVAPAKQVSLGQHVQLILSSPYRYAESM